MLAIALIGVCGYWMWSRSPVRHVIVISLDTTRADHFGCYGNPWIHTPRIDKLASESVLFSNYMTVVPTTLASHTSLFTGTYPHTHGTPKNGYMVNEDNVMLPEILRDAGFRTAGFVGSFALESRFNFAQGFDHYDETFDQFKGEDGADQNQRSAKAVTDAVIKYLDERSIPPHLFLFVHYFDPHAPYSPSPEYAKLYDPNGGAGLPHRAAVDRWLARTPGQQNHLASLLGKRYAGEISYMDEHIGRLLDTLSRRGILDEAIVVVTSDHGENLGEYRMQFDSRLTESLKRNKTKLGRASRWIAICRYFDHGLTTYEETMHAVCMIRLPRAAGGGKKIDELVASIDILPTLLDYLGLPVPQGIDGQAVDLVRGVVPSSPRTRFGEASKPWQLPTSSPRWHNSRNARCVREGNLKYVRTPYLQFEELYDLSVDPHERKNLLGDATPETHGKAGELRQKLEKWTNSARPLPSDLEATHREDTVRRLKSLGYLGGTSVDDEDDDQNG
ncbi:MAG: sulfatase [Phycisphaerae bacterium]|nr:sulfatase [Phycisphaerae bacterium]